jgi:transposase
LLFILILKANQVLIIEKANKKSNILFLKPEVEKRLQERIIIILNIHKKNERKILLTRLNTNLKEEEVKLFV